ncbi:methylmalonyl-CoA mutase family protein [Thermodesulfobacteriota bacterium]
MEERSSFSRIPLKAFYRPEDTQGMDYQENLNDPGQFPYTRGNRLPKLASGAWIERELSGEGDPVRSNEQFKYLLQKGQTGIDVIGDSPTMSWIDPEHPLVKHSVGSQGVSLCCLQDYRELYRDLPLDAITISNSLPGPFAIAGLYLTAMENGYPPAKVRGSVVQFVLYGEDCGYAVNLPLSLRLRLVADAIVFCSREMPRFHHFLEDTYYISESGLDSVEEMALGFIEIRYVVRHLLERGVDIDSFAPRIALLVNCRMDVFEEIAKIRATRRIFARMMKEEFGAKDPRSLAVVVTSHTSGLSLTAQQPVNNISRGAVQALALALAGVQAIEISAFDEAFRTPSPESHLVGLRTQQVIQLESNVNLVTDPLGGSYYVESLTDEMEERILEMIRAIETKGDPGELCDQGEFRRIFTQAMERYSEQVRTGETKKVGLNVHQIPEEEDTLLKDVAEAKIDPCYERTDKIRAYKGSRDQVKVKEALARLRQAAEDRQEILQYPIIEAMQAGATMGEMVGVMRSAYGGPYDVFDMVRSPI